MAKRDLKSKIIVVENRAKNLSTALLILIALASILALCAFILAVRYVDLNLVMGNVSVLSPPIRFYVNTTPTNATGLILVPTNQVFCPESAVVQKAASESFTYPYYAMLQPGEIFRYSLTFNSTSSVTAVYVKQPFKLLSYTVRNMENSVCVGYPNTKSNLTLVMEAPNYTFVGKVFGTVYFTKNS